MGEQILNAKGGEKMFSVRTLRKGFTLVELMVVIAVIAILSGIAFFGFRTVQANARDTQRIQVMSALRGQLERYYGDNNTYPNTTVFGTMLTTIQANTTNLQDPGCGTSQLLYSTWGVSVAADPPGVGAGKPTAAGGCSFASTGTQPYYQYAATGCAGGICPGYTLTLYKEGGGTRAWSGPQ